MTSEDARDMLVVPQLKELLSEKSRAQWKFPPSAVAMIEGLVSDLDRGAYLP
jgi:hypothetical protein